MPRCLRLLAVELILLAAPLATLAAGPPKPLVFEISYSKELSASPMDGHVLLIISKGDLPVAAGFGVQEGLETQQAFGVDVDGWQPGTAVRVDRPRLVTRSRACANWFPANTPCGLCSTFTKLFIWATAKS